MSEEQIIAAIDKEANASFEKGDYGFIMGTQHPFYGASHGGFTSSVSQPGFITWVKNLKGEVVQKDFYTYDQKKTLRDIINFIKENRKIIKYKLSEKTG